MPRIYMRSWVRGAVDQGWGSLHTVRVISRRLPVHAKGGLKRRLGVERMHDLQAVANRPLICLR